jgi:membrane protease YdiL (CAAX protease family)
MENQVAVKKRVITFLGLTFLFSSVFYYLIITKGGMQAGGGAYVMALMWCPGIAAFITKFVYQKSLRGMGWGWGKTRYQLLSYGLPVFYTAVCYALIWAVGLGIFNSQPVADQLGRQLRSGGMIINSREALLIMYFSVALTAGFLMSAILAFGEEVGWRGLFVPEVARLTSFTKTALLTGVVWSVWHYPLILFANYNNRTPAWFGLTCFTVLIVGINFAFTWLRLKTGSLWTGVIFHAAHNLYIQSIFTPLTRRGPYTRYFIDEFGVALAVAALVVAFYFWRRRAEVEGLPPSTAESVDVGVERYPAAEATSGAGGGGGPQL